MQSRNYSRAASCNEEFPVVLGVRGSGARVFEL